MSDLFDLPFEEDDDSQQSTVDSRQSAVGARRVLTVTELNVRVRDLIETEFGEIWVEGELSNCRVWNTGHLYFTLKDSAAQVRAVIFRSALRYLKFKPTDGLRVVARGRLSVYEPKGEYQLVCEHMEPHGLGALQLAFDQLKKRLQEEGLFDASRKRPLPALPRKIGIVTSIEGAAVRDIIKVLRRRYANAHLIIRPTRVQGEGAAAEIGRGLGAIGRVPHVDVVIVGRGGGSIEDLWAFNEESVARAIAACPVPVISAVGHETDVTIADFVADLRAPTPSAAAEMVVTAKDEFIGRIDRLRDRIRAAVGARVQGRSHRLHALVGRPA
ncbi:MAG: exodeoxyribonuclease VII large subunit, partial [Vicinamibacterales bacterium]